MVNSGVTIIVSLAFTIVTHAGRYAGQSLISRLFVGPPIVCLPQLAGTGVSICQCWVTWSTNTCSLHYHGRLQVYLCGMDMFGLLSFYH